MPCIPQSSSITGTSPSDCLVLYPGHSLWDITTLQRSSRCIRQHPHPADWAIGMSCFVCIAWPCLVIFWVSFLSPIIFNLPPCVLSKFTIVLFWSFHPNICLHVFSSLELSLVVTNPYLFFWSNFPCRFCISAQIPSGNQYSLLEL